MYKALLFIVIFSFEAAIAQAQRNASPTVRATASVPAPGYFYSDPDEAPRGIQFPERTVTAEQFLNSVNTFLKITPDLYFEEVGANLDHLGMRHRMLQQYHQGVPVEGMEYRVHERNGFLTSANGRALKNIQVDMQSSLQEEHAFRLAVSHLNSTDSIYRSGSKLIVSKDFTYAPGSFRLAYRFDIDVSLIERWRISIDAKSGSVINKVSLVQNCVHHDHERQPPPYVTGLGRTNYYGVQPIRVDMTGGGSRTVGITDNGGTIETTDFQNQSARFLLLGFPIASSPFYSSNTSFLTNYQKPGVSVHWAAEKTFEYYFTKHQRNSFDNNGSVIKSYVHVDVNFDNAFWNGRALAFGDGSNNNPLVELDVVAHEFTHGVTQYEAGLQYYYESGALNESFSDILAKAVEFDLFGDTATWTIARRFGPGGLRNMSSPNLKQHPDTYLGDMWFTSSLDNGGVHYNSGVQNFWFYLLCEGGSGVNDHDRNYEVEAIGIEAATNIAYRNLTEYLGSSSQYLDSRIGSLLAAADLYGMNSSIYEQVRKAWDAVGVTNEPIITTFALSNITATTVKVESTIVPRGENVTYHIDYGLTSGLGNATPPMTYSGSIEYVLTGLLPSTKYYLRLVTTNESGSSYSRLEEFTTLTLSPLVRLNQTVNATATTAALFADINPNSLMTSYRFEYGLTPALGLTTPWYPISDATVFVPVSALIEGLEARKTYYYKVTAQNSFSNASSGLLTFFTANKPVILSFTPEKGEAGTGMVITGTGFNPNPQNNVVMFGATRAVASSSTSNEIHVHVPEGASFGSISVLDAETGLTGQSSAEFVPTFTGNFGHSSLQRRIGIYDTDIDKVLVDDVDGDGKPDIIAQQYNGLAFYQNVHQGIDLTDQSFLRISYPASGLSNVLLADMDGNGKNDIVGVFGNGIRIYPNLSVPGYIFFDVPVDLPIADTYRFVCHDFDGDGRTDIANAVMVSGQSTIVNVYRNRNQKGIVLPDNFQEQFSLTLPCWLENFSIADLNKDGAADLFTDVYDRDFFSVLVNESTPGHIAFTETNITVPSRGIQTKSISHDFNKDGWNDVAVVFPQEVSNMMVLENSGDSPTPGFTPPLIPLNNMMASTLKAGDIDGDGNVDMLVSQRSKQFYFMKNTGTPGSELTDSTFRIAGVFGGNGEEYGESGIVVNDLSGDGRPDVVLLYAYYPGAYRLEVWQNAEVDCPDARLVSVTVTNGVATIHLPAGSSIDDWDMQYAFPETSDWWELTGTQFDLGEADSYRLRVRAKCYLGYTPYHYLTFSRPCENVNNFSVGFVEQTSVMFYMPDSGAFEIEYSRNGENQWIQVPRHVTYLTGLVPGTTYDVRYRPRCEASGEFHITQFTTDCAAVGLGVSYLTYNAAHVYWWNGYQAEYIIEYSMDHLNWQPVSADGWIYSLTPGTRYTVRGTTKCEGVGAGYTNYFFVTHCPDIYVSVDDVTESSVGFTVWDESQTGRYLVQYTLSGTGITQTREMTSRAFTLDNLLPGSTYSVAVAAVCNGMESYQWTTVSTRCRAVYDARVSMVTNSSAQLSWSANGTKGPYYIEIKERDGYSRPMVTTTDSTFMLASLRPGREYDLKIYPTCQGGRGPGIMMTFKTTQQTETLYAPNPTDGEVVIYPMRNMIGKKFIVTDNMGRDLYSGIVVGHTFDLSGLAAGTYLLRIEGEKPMRVVKR